MLGVFHLLLMVEKYPTTSLQILKYSQHEKYEFPLAIKMFEFTTLCLVLMRTGKLYDWANREGSVWSVTNQAFVALFFKFITVYILTSSDITSINQVSRQIETEAKKIGVKKSI